MHGQVNSKSIVCFHNWYMLAHLISIGSMLRRLVLKNTRIFSELMTENSKITIDSRTHTHKIRVLLVESNQTLSKTMKYYLETQGIFEVETADSAKEAVEKVQFSNFDVVASDYVLPEKNGLELLEESKNSIDIPFILFTDMEHVGIIVEALNNGAYRCIVKIDEIETFLFEISSTLKQAAEKRRNEFCLKESEKRFRQITENSLVWIWEVDVKGIYTFSSPTVEKIIGYKSEEILGKKHFYDFFTPEKKEELEQAILKAYKNKETFRDFFNQKVHKNGKTLMFSTSAMPILDKRGKIIGYRGIDKDVTEIAEVEKKLAESEAKYRDIFENARDAIYIHDLKGKISSINGIIQEYGYSKEQVVGRNLLRFVPIKYWAKLISQFSQVAKGKQIEGEIEVITPNGRRTAEYRSNPIIRGKEVIGAQAILRDISERKKIEEALIENQEKFKALFTANPEAAVFLDNTFHVIEANSKFTKIFGYTLDEIKGKIITEIIVPKESEEESKKIREKILKGPVEIISSRKRKDGSKVKLLMSGGPVAVDSKIIGSVMVYKDITDLITVQEELSKALIKAELLNEKLSVVGGFTRHDVRNKLAVINGNLYLAEKLVGENTQVCSYIERIKNAVSNVNRILEFAKNFEMLGSQELTLTDIGKAVDEAVSLFYDLKGVKIVNECKGVNVLADSMLTTIFYNLIDNSLKYGQDITQIRIYCQPELECFKFLYEDNGVGIDAEIKKQMFTKGIGKGTGYGLYLIRRTCEIYGWTVQETGQPGTGVRFEFNIKKSNANIMQA